MVDAGVEVLGPEAEELPVALEQRLVRGERRVLGLEAGAARLEVEVVRDDRLRAAHVLLGVREQLAAHDVRVAALRASVVERQERVRNADALLDLKAAVLRGGARASVLDGDAEALGHVGDDRVGVGVDRGPELRRILVLERRGAGLEERIVLLGVGGGDDEQVVLEPEHRLDVPALGRGGIDVHHGAESVGER